MLLFKCNIFLKFLFLVLIGLVCAHIKISDRRLCVDDKCEVPISEGTTLLRYNSPSKNILSFGPKEKVTIFSKSAGSNPTLWGAEINGKRGYIPKDNIREIKVFHIPGKLVATEFVNDSPTIEVPSKGPKQTETVLSPEPVKELYEVIDGTKVPVDVGAFSKDSINDKTADDSSNTVETNKEKTQDEKELKDIANNTNEVPDGIISSVIHFFSNADDKGKEPVDVTTNEKEKEEDDEDEDEEEDDDYEDDVNDEENEDDDEEEESEEKIRVDSLSNKKSEAKAEVETSGEKNSNSIEQKPLQFNEASLETETNKIENVGKIIKQENNVENVINPTLEITKGKLEEFSNNLSNTSNSTEEKKDDASSTNVENKEQLQGKAEQEAESILGINPLKVTVLQQSINDLNQLSEVDIKKNSEAKPELETSYEKDSGIIRRNLLQFNDESLKTKNNEIENGEKTIKQNNNAEKITDPTLEKTIGKSEELSDNTEIKIDVLNSENQTLTDAKKDDTSNIENKEQLQDKTKHEAESVLGIDPVIVNVLQQSIDNSNKISAVDAKKNSEAKPESLEIKTNETENLEKMITQENNTEKTLKKNEGKSEELDNNITNTSNSTAAIANISNSENQTLTEEKKEDTSSTNVKNKEQLQGKAKQKAENVLNVDPVKLNVSQRSPEKIVEVDVNNISVKKDDLIGNENSDKNLNKPEENKNAFDSRETQKSNLGEKPIDLKETQPIETLINTNSYIDLQNISEALSQNIQENFLQNFQKIQEDLTKNTKDFTQDFKDVKQVVQEEVIQNNDEKSPDDHLTSDNNKNNYLNIPNDDPFVSQSSNLYADSFYKDVKLESNSIPESLPIHAEDENQNMNKKISNDIYQTLQESSLFIHQNEKNQLSEREAISISGIEQGNDYCLKSENAEDCALDKRDSSSGNDFFQETIIEFLFNLPNDVVSTVLITALTTILFLLGYVYIDKSSRIRPLIAKINKLEKALLLTEEENKLAKEQLLQEQSCVNDKVNDGVSSEVLGSLQQQLEDAINAKTSLEEQIVNLERELENSTEVGLELNRMLSDFLSSQDSDVLVANIEQLQRQLVEQQGTINSYSETLNAKETEIHELRLELEISNSKVTDLHKESERATVNLLKIEEEKYEIQKKLESEVSALKKHIEQLTISSTAQINKLTDELKALQKKAEESQRNSELKTKECNLLKENTLKLKTLKDEDISSLLDVASFKAELELLLKEKHLLLEHYKQSEEVKDSIEKQYQKVVDEMKTLQRRYDEADKEKLEAQTKLEVLENYFKEREANLQKELAKHEAMFMEKQGETYSITEKIKFMQEELQNYKAQNESLKQEIMEQEVQMKSQISLLEKRVHENWVNARQSERKLEEAKQEAAQLRNRLTIRERTLQEEKYQNRLKSPAEQNGELPVSPTPASPPLIFGARDLTTSPPLQGLPPPFLPPPPFMPPPMPGGVPPPFMPPPSSMPPLPAMFPSDRRPAPLGRMSSPPIDSRYSPDSRAYSPYSRNSPSPTSDDDYCHSPPPLHRGYSPINNRESKREYRRSPGANKVSRNHKGSMHSSGSANSNESLEKIARKQSKV